MRRAARTARNTARSSRSNACSTLSSRNEGEPDIVQISGGEPTIHPRVLRDPRRRQAPPHPAPDGQHQRHPHRAGRSLRRAAGHLHAALRTLSAVRLAATRPAHATARRRPAQHPRRSLERLNRLGISTTLVVTVERGVNDDELGAIIDFALAAALRPRRHLPARAAGRARSATIPPRSTGSR